MSLAVAAFFCALAVVAGVETGPVELVLSRSEGDISWVSKLADGVRTTVYNQGAAIAAKPEAVQQLVNLPEAESQAHAYLLHIVRNYDKLADKVVFMPGAEPETGFKGFNHYAANLLPGASVDQYVAANDAELFVPTMAMSADLQQISVRKSFMEPDEAEPEMTACTRDGPAGWTTYMPNTYASKVLAPLVSQQQEGEVLSFGDFWRKHLPGTPLPESLQVAHGSVFSVLRSNIWQHPKSFYEALLADASDAGKPYLAMYVEAMWWYIFHPKATQPCPNHESTAVASHRRMLNVISMLVPTTGSSWKFGQVMKIEWSSSFSAQWRIELWQNGDFQTRIVDLAVGDSYEWMISPDAADPTWKSQLHGNGEKWTAFTLQPGSRFTIRICDRTSDSSQPEDEQMCDTTYGESGEFDIVPTVTMLEPPCGSAYSAPSNIQVVWNSFYVPSSKVTIGLYTSGGFLLWSDSDIENTGYYNFYAPYDMESGSYMFKVIASCTTAENCNNYWMGEGGEVVGTGCIFSVATAPSPPPSPALPNGGSPAMPTMLPIIKTFESHYGSSIYSTNTGSVYDYNAADYSTDCNKVCYAGQGRRLLFGGLGYVQAANGLTLCNNRQLECDCPFCENRRR